MAVATRPPKLQIDNSQLAGQMAQHRGEWVAIKEGRVVAWGRTPTDVFDALDREGIRGAAIDRVPENPDTVFVL